MDCMLVFIVGVVVYVTNFSWKFISDVDFSHFNFNYDDALYHLILLLFFVVAFIVEEEKQYRD